LLLARERRRIAHPKAQDYADIKVGLQQRIAIGEMVFNDQLALQKKPERSLSALRLHPDRRQVVSGR
jgi:hypothetical protein